jgi:predicted MFS family arabinose efflux permease
LREGWQEFVSRQWLVVTVVSMSFFFLAFEAFQAVIAPVQMKEALGGARDLGFMMAAWGVGGFIGMLGAVRLRPRRPMLAAWSIMPVHAVWMFALAVPAPLPLLMLAAVVSGMAIDLSFTWFGTTLQTQVPEDVISRVGSFDALGAALFGPVGLVIAGPLVDSVGASTTSTVAGIVALVSGVAPLVFASVRRLESVV